MTSMLRVEFTADELRECANVAEIRSKKGNTFQRTTGINKAKLEELLGSKGVTLEDFGKQMFTSTVLKHFGAIKADAQAITGSGGGKKTAQSGQAKRTPPSTGTTGKTPASAKSTGGSAAARGSRGKTAANTTPVEAEKKEEQAVVKAEPQPKPGWFASALNAAADLLSPAAVVKGKGGAAAAATPAAEAAAPPPAALAKGKGRAKAAEPKPAGEELEAKQSGGGRRTRSSAKASPAEASKPGGDGSPQVKIVPGERDAPEPESDDAFTAVLAAQHWPDVRNLTAEDFMNATAAAQAAAAFDILPDEPQAEQLMDAAHSMAEHLSAAFEAEDVPYIDVDEVETVLRSLDFSKD